MQHLWEDVRRCLPKVDFVTEEAPLKSPQHLFALRTLAILLGCSAMASGGKGYYAAQAAASSSSGGDPAPGMESSRLVDDDSCTTGASMEGE